MIVIKRNGKEEAFNPSKIQKRILDRCEGLKVNGDELAIKVISGFADRMTTVELDNLAAETAATMMMNHPDYGYLASRIAVSRLHKETHDTFYRCTEDLALDTDLMNQKWKDLCWKHRTAYGAMIVHERDYNFDYFGYKTLERAYLLRANGKVVERPQYMFMRVAVSLWEDNVEMVKKVYDELSTGLYIHATPTLFNAGTKHQQLSSCFLIANKGDSKEELLDTFKDVSIISSYAGGIGLHIHDVRADNSKIHGSGGKSNGILPLLRTYNEGSKWWNQQGKRNGSYAIYLEPWHRDIEVFLDIRKNHGKEELRARELFPALWIPDLFMQRVEANSYWTLFCPNEILRYNGTKLQELVGDEFTVAYLELELNSGLGTQIKAQDLWTAILTSQMETGVPYLLYKDSANNKSNQKNLGTIKSSNLCVAPETQILTSSGYQVISELEDEEVDVWNGKEYSTVTILKTSDASKLLRVTLSNGHTIDATEYHKWYIQRGYRLGSGVNKLQLLEKRTVELKKGDKLIKLVTPVIDFEEEFADAYTQGFFSGDGCRYKDKNHIDLYGEKQLLASFLKGSLVGTINTTQDKQRFNIDNSYVKFEVPSKYSIKSRLEWLAGLCDSDGCLLNNNGTQAIQISSIELTFLQEIQLMLQTLGVNSKVLKASPEGLRNLPDGKGGMKLFQCKESFRLNIGADGIYELTQLGFNTNRLKLNGSRPNRNAEQFIKIISVEDLGRMDTTYCANEPKEHKLVFNGVITGNCAEIIEYSSPDEQAVCNLASLALPKFVLSTMMHKFVGGFKKVYSIDHKALYEAAYQVTLNLNRVIDINYYPTIETKNSNMRHKPIGIGCQGEADVFAIMKLAFDSEEAKTINKEIFETIYFGALSASCDLAKELGPYESYEGSPASKGILQYDMWNVTPSNRWNWNKLKEDIKANGLRNSLLLAPMPTASTSQILGWNECFEPFNSNLSTRGTLAGQFIIINKHLVKELEAIGLWNASMKNKLVLSNGSVQNIPEIPSEIKAIYKTAYEISQKVIIDMAADRGAYVCQSQSMNLFVTSPTISKLSSMHFYGWKKGLKTGMYYLRTKAAVDAIKGLGMSNVIQEKEVPQNIEITGQVCEIGCDNCGS